VITTCADKLGRVCVEVVLGLPVSAAEAWRALEDFEHFVTLDAFHRRVHADRPVRQVGTAIRIEHGVGPFLLLMRVGRVLRWDEGVGYSFSDLSARGRGVGFPHVYEYSIRSIGPNATCLTVRVKGRWTARWVPLPVVRAWLHWVMSWAAARIAWHFLRGKRELTQNLRESGDGTSTQL